VACRPEHGSPERKAAGLPLVFGTQFQAGFRASEPTRVLKVGARSYCAVAASSPELARTMDELARERIGGLQKPTLDLLEGKVRIPNRSTSTANGRVSCPTLNNQSCCALGVAGGIPVAFAGRND
jgi:thioredoxin reductase (NADPH)